MKFEILEETFTSEKNKEEIPGVTIVIEGDLERVLDTIIRLDPSYKSYTAIIASALVKGINKAAVIYKNDELMIFEEDLYNKKSNQKIKGIRIMITGKLKALLNRQISFGEFQRYSEAIGTDLKIGLKDVINACKDRTVQNG